MRGTRCIYVIASKDTVVLEIKHPLFTEENKGQSVTA